MEDGGNFLGLQGLENFVGEELGNPSWMTSWKIHHEKDDVKNGPHLPGVVFSDLGVIAPKKSLSI